MASLTLALPFGFAWLFLALRLSLRGRAIPAPHLRMLPSHLSVMRAHLGITRHLIHRMGPVSSTTSSPGSFAGMHFGLVSPSGGPHFIRSNVFWRSSKSDALPVFSRLLSIHFFSREFFVGLSF